MLPRLSSRRWLAAALLAASGMYVSSLPTWAQEPAPVDAVAPESAPIDGALQPVPGSAVPGTAIPADQACPPDGSQGYDGSGAGGRQGCRYAVGTGCREWGYGQPDLFYNYYVPPVCGGVGAQLYVSPLPVPQHVGHTYITYQPLMPHEFLYHHHRVYHRYYDEGRGFTRTSVGYYNPPVRQAVHGVHNMLRIAR